MMRGRGWGQGKPEMVICLRLPQGSHTPRVSGWHPSSFHSQQSQKVGLVGPGPLDLGVDIKRTSPPTLQVQGRVTRSTPSHEVPNRGPMSPASGLLAPTSCPYCLPLGFTEGGFCLYCPPLVSEKNPLGTEAGGTLHYSNVFHGASGAPPSPGDLTPGTCFQ